ncbi:glycoside hydrolase family 88 protein [Paenibacillus sp. Marseille-Q4541]|uniref:glycoside hydrolase family 88 protein n=1 Tax=Paenibacillus sp. Marseille-Q4541 TaxID=2831522 RepID=UPI001BAAF340|nr:glycoside hydrolase family 88 protein [Paenibacillus sp. Marseille-Q4541]
MAQLQIGADQAVWEQICKKVDTMMLNIGSKSPHVAGDDGIYDDLRLDAWTSGFWPGILWIMYDMTGEKRYKEAAWPWDERMEQLFIQENRFSHDVGFQFLPTAVIKHTLTGDTEASRRGLFAANFLAGRFNLQGKFLRAWGEEKIGWSIVDTAMNLSILFWASKVSKDPRYHHIAKAHADTVIEHFIREDGSTYHIVRFDPETGARVDALGGQGDAEDSAWSRGAAWALYGMTNAYTYTGDSKYLKAAQRVANFFIAHLPEDSVPHWDFRADLEGGQIPRDSSAGACAASGLLDLASLLEEKEGRYYLAAAKRILDSLYENYGTWNDSSHEGMLIQGTGHKPADKNVNVSLIYGDYYFVEAIAKLNGWKHRIF